MHSLVIVCSSWNVLHLKTFDNTKIRVFMNLEKEEVFKTYLLQKYWCIKWKSCSRPFISCYTHFYCYSFSINAQKLWWNMLWYCECNMKEKFEIWAFRLIFKRKKWGQDEIQNNAKVFTISYIHRQLFINMKIYSHDKLWFYENFAKIK